MRKHKLVLLLLPLLLAGCFSKVETQGLQFLVGKEVNNNAPVALDLVAVSDPGLLLKLGKLSAWQWFEGRKQLQQDNPFHLQVWSWEIVPASSLERFELPSSARDAYGILLFANYSTPGLHRARLGPFAEVLLQLEKNDMQVRVIGD